jgi:hypothetical protein
LKEVEIFNALTKARMDALELQVTNLGMFQARTWDTFQVVNNHLGRHRKDIHSLTWVDEEMMEKFNVNTSVLCDSLLAIETKIVSMVDKLCHCAAPSPVLGMGMSNSPYELEYADDDTPTKVPVENVSPIPVPSCASLETPQGSGSENIPLLCRDTLHLIEGGEEGNGYIGMLEEVLDELRVLCEVDAKEAMAGPSMDPIEQYVGMVRDFRHQVACQGRRSDPTCGLRCLPGSNCKQQLHRDRKSPVGHSKNAYFCMMIGT